MKILFCGNCFAFHSFKEREWTTCDCKQMAARWIDAAKGTVEVLAEMPRRAFLIGMNNNFLRSAGARDNTDSYWQRAHHVATLAPGYIFDVSKRNCWACIVVVGETSDISWHPNQNKVETHKMTIAEAIANES